ncbi:hypothetical protein C0583_04000 [Candidatus Parcubacteria bacterium]|nr:MAG: hypothetical protein C0583_04000 [Candidatus Parcubacteria bacterium]
MDTRKELILNTILKEHIKTGLPVASKMLVEKYKLDISPATVRNEMAALELDDYIIQPHTSSGRIPTERAYNWMLNSIKTKSPNPSEIDIIEDALKNKNETGFKQLAKHLSQTTGNAVFWAFHKHNLYYTGISNLFQQPEFSRINVIHDISTVIDRLDEIVNLVIDETEQGVHTLVGENNPFGSIFGVSFAKYKLKENLGMFGVLGPMRMDYQKVISLVDFINKSLK